MSNVTVNNNPEKYSLSFIDYGICGATLLVSVLISIYFGCFRGKQATVDKYLLGGNKMKSFPVAASLIACHVSSITLLGIPAEVYVYGATYFLATISIMILCVLLIFIYLPVFHKLRLTSIFEYLESRFDRKTRLLASILYMIRVASLIPLTLFVPTLTMSDIFGIDFKLTLTIVCCICILYTVIGGLNSIVWIDVFQLIIIIGAFLVIFIMGTVLVGGPSVVWNKARISGRLDIFDFDPDPTKRDSFWITVIGTTAVILSENCSQSSVVKLSTIPKFRDCVVAVILYGFGIFLLRIGSTVNGLIVYSEYSNCDPLSTGQIKKADAVVPHFIMKLVQDIPGLPGLFVAGVFCASLSTFSTELNAIVGVIYKDYIFGKLSTTSEKKTVKILKLIVILAGIFLSLLVFVVDRLGGVFQLLFSVTGIFGGAILGVFSLGILVPRAHSKGAFYGCLLAMLFLACLLIPSKYYQYYNMFSYPTKKLSTKGCRTNYTMVSEKNHFQQRNSTSTFQPNFMFRISFYYYCFIGAVITLISGTVISYLTKKADSPVDKTLVTPVCHRFLTEKSDEKGYNGIPMDTIS